MVWAASLGLPLSLEGVGTVLGLDNQKLLEGKNLIRYFCVPCQPTKVNGGRSRNLPSDELDKWSAFKSYNVRDVEVELSIQDKLSRFPVSQDIWEDYWLDQEINDRGIALDLEMVHHALELDKRSKMEISSQLQAITGLENPNSVLQMREWLIGQGLENDRGLALSDADIFKAKLYNHLSQDEKTEFIEKWQQLDEDALDVSESIQKLFYYYMFYLRALENDRNTTTPGIRKYYSKNNFEKLYKSGVIEDLNKLVNLWLVVNNRTEIDNEDWSKNIKIKQVLDGLSSYPNEFWKYPVVIYYLTYHKNNEFENKFLNFLQRLLAVLSARYIVTPTINAVKRGILNLNAEIINSPTPKFDFNEINEKELKEKIKNAHRNTVRMILKILAYQHQKELLPEKWEIEHILPQKWQSSYFPNTSEKEVKELVEHIGNKIPFEKKLNIIASNGYFAKKQLSYEKSRVQILIELANNHSNWGMDEIRERDIRISDELYTLLKSWGLNEDNSMDLRAHMITIPADRISDYQNFLLAVKWEDTDENRQKFLKM
ncbi:DUF1524 domain-containing protein [Listeria monocytogenes]|nr:DUF1524 domain-containing protein [Listeria monocytogenes]ECJ9721722.1 DUF1524 domain-containing protein [Listeria monocytogenes]TYU28570.1 DUF1524 domain-containing protein [Listeria monocytogenes]